MSLRKFMHPRNTYKKVPNFKDLAVLYPEFRKVANTTLAGKVRIDFKNEESLRILTEVLLKHDFGLDVKIPPNKLVPTLPLRLNYVLWIEDLMKHASFSNMESLTGIDIGTGAVCIYPLLMAKLYKCHMIGTDVDETSVTAAEKNVLNNNLQDLIKLVKVNSDEILKEVIEDEMYHFVMCNPPFFGSKEESSKSTKRLPPRNALTGNEIELCVEGGERRFVGQMIEESIKIREKIKIYTSMLGKKNNMLYLIKLLKKHRVNNLTWTEFCQGHTTRWGIAWSFLPKDTVDLTKAPIIRKGGDFTSKLLKDRPSEIIFPTRETLLTIDDFRILLNSWIQELKVDIKELNPKDFNGWACKLTAENNSWSHTRRKRRLAQRLGLQTDTLECANQKIANAEPPSATNTSTSDLEPEEPFLVFDLFVDVGSHEEVREKESFRLSMVFDTGKGGRNAMETFRQYLINKLNIREYFQKQQSDMNKRKTKRVKREKRDDIKMGDETLTHLDVSSDEDYAEFSS